MRSGPKWLDVVGTRRSDGSTEPSSYQAPEVGPRPAQYALAGDAPPARPGIRRWMLDASLVGIAARPVWLMRRPDFTAGNWAKLVRSDGRPAAGDAEELIPAEARIRALDYGNCVELANSPSCAGVVFELPERAASRCARVVRATAERHGWTVVKMDDAEGGWSLFLRRPDYTANVVLWRPEVYGLTCKGAQPPDKCFNTLALQRNS